MSSRLRQTLIHPDKNGILEGLRYSADGRRLFANHYSSGLVQVWDAISGRQLTSIEKGAYNIHLLESFRISPDGESLYLNHVSEHQRIVKVNDKRLIRVEYTGGVRRWDVTTGKPLKDFPPAPRCGTMSTQLSPDGSTLLTFDYLSGDYENGAWKWSGVLWDTRTAQRCGALPKNAAATGVFSPDSKMLLTDALNEKGEMTALLFLDAKSGDVRRSILLTAKHRKAYVRAFSPDGKRVVCNVVETTTGRNWLMFWEVDSGRETATFEGEKKDRFRQPVFSPHGRMLAVTNLVLEGKKLYLIDAVDGKLIKTVPLAERSLWSRPVFSPDGRWIAVVSEQIPKNLSIFKAKTEDLPQPHILLIEAASGEVRETIVAPPGGAQSLCFSPDGETLASGGDGRVLLWDMTKPPGKEK